MLSADSIVEKHFAVLNLSEVKSFEDASMLVSNLVGQDFLEKIREASGGF